MIQISDYLGRWAKHPEVTEDVLKNAKVVVSKVSELLSRMGVDKVVITSGFRPHAYNAQIGGSKNSLHCKGLAIDLSDPDEKIGKWCVANVEALREIGLFMESLERTHKDKEPQKKWCHLQAKGPPSGNIIFLP